MKNNIKTNLTNSVIGYLDTIIETAIEKKASDIHIKYNSEEFELKYRIDGNLLEDEELYNKINEKIIEKNIVEIMSRIKILSNLNVAEKRKPQDGSFSYIDINKNKYDIRVAFLPIIEGESVVLRILKNFLEDIQLKTLGFLEKNEKIIIEMLNKKYGLILVTGPTGSGKSTTLTSMINILNNGEKKIITVEDPVENKIKGITQVQVNNEIGVTFPEVLKSILRSDPDVIVISEIRDEITAEIAIRAALTGHLVISTLHTNDVISTLVRLEDMKIPKYLILDSLVGIIGQRLIGKKVENKYRGRVSINEILYFDEKVRNVLKKNELGENVKKELKEIENIKFIDFFQDIIEKIEKNIVFEKDVSEYLK